MICPPRIRTIYPPRIRWPYFSFRVGSFERELIRARTGDGIRLAKAAGVHMGRPPKQTKHQQREVLARLDRGETLTDIARFAPLASAYRGLQNSGVTARPKWRGSAPMLGRAPRGHENTN